MYITQWLDIRFHWSLVLADTNICDAKIETTVTLIVREEVSKSYREDIELGRRVCIPRMLSCARCYHRVELKYSGSRYEIEENVSLASVEHDNRWHNLPLVTETTKLIWREQPRWSLLQLNCGTRRVDYSYPLKQFQKPLCFWNGNQFFDTYYTSRYVVLV